MVNDAQVPLSNIVTRSASKLIGILCLCLISLMTKCRRQLSTRRSYKTAGQIKAPKRPPDKGKAPAAPVATPGTKRKGTEASEAGPSSALATVPPQAVVTRSSGRLRVYVYNTETSDEKTDEDDGYQNSDESEDEF
eukprot:jgi/Mesvir1/28268/Mv04796-RA.1